MIGRVNLLPDISSISLIDPPWLSMVLADKPINLTPLSELWLKLCESTELSRADWSVIFWVREENNPFVVNEFVEVDGAICGLILEVGRNGAQAEAEDGKVLANTTNKWGDMRNSTSDIDDRMSPIIRLLR
jgi:hypothetical protein